MSNISQQPVANPLSLADQFLVWSGGSGDTRRASISTLAALIAANITVALTPAQQAMLPTFLPFVGGGNAIIASAAVGITVPAYNLGQGFRFVPVLSNSGATTINIATLGVKNLFINGGACIGGEIVAGVPVDIVYDGVQFQIVGNGAALQAGYGQIFGVGKKGDANTEFMKLSHNGALAIINADKTGTGAARNFSFQQAGVEVMNLGASTGMWRASNVSGVMTWQVQNTDTTNLSSDANVSVITGGSLAGDPAITFSINGLTNWKVGIDNSDGDKYKVSNSGTLGTVDLFTIAPNGRTTMISNVTGLGLVDMVHSGASPVGIGVTFSTADPNNTANTFFSAAGIATERFTARSNGGLANFSANNVNLSDLRVKDDFQEYTPEILDDLETRFLAIQRGRFKYKDQTHEDWNYGITAQSVKAAIPELAGIWNEKKTVERTEQKQVTRMADFVDEETGAVQQREVSALVDVATAVFEDVPEADQLLCVYDHDITQIAEALLARLLVRVRKLEEKA